MDLKKVIKGLSKLERAVLPFLDKSKDLKSLEAATSLKGVEVVRALQWLQNKKIVDITEENFFKEVVVEVEVVSLHLDPTKRIVCKSL